MIPADRDEPRDDLSLGELFRPLLNYRRFIWRTTIGLTLLTALIGGAYLMLQPTQWRASLEFRPVFDGADAGQDPNKLPFAVTDITDPTVIDQVFDNNHVQDYCTRDAFRWGFATEENALELRLLDFDYEARLADAKLSSIDRQRTQDEYRLRRLTLPRGYRLMYAPSAACARLPPALATKALNEILQTWATDADTKRGVLKMRVAVLTPNIFDFGNVGDQSLLVRADLIRSALLRLIANIQDVQRLQGAELIRYGEQQTSLLEVQTRLEDLVQAHLDPLVAVAGRGLGKESARWVDESLQVATAQRQAAKDQADAYKRALEVYSGMTSTPAPAASSKSTGPSDVQTLTPQIDRTFVDRIVELQSANTTYRQKMTDDMVAASVREVRLNAAVEHYKQLRESLKSSGESTLTPAEVTNRLVAIVEEGKRLARLLNGLYDEFSRVSLRPGPKMYRVEQPVYVSVSRSFSTRSYELIVVSVFFMSLIVLAVGCLLYDRLSRLTGDRTRA